MDVPFQIPWKESFMNGSFQIPKQSLGEREKLFEGKFQVSNAITHTHPIYPYVKVNLTYQVIQVL